jgi:hypothetical protein
MRINTQCGRFEGWLSVYLYQDNLPTARPFGFPLCFSLLNGWLGAIFLHVLPLFQCLLVLLLRIRRPCAAQKKRTGVSVWQFKFEENQGPSGLTNSPQRSWFVPPLRCRTLPEHQPYSLRRALTGSIVAARRAGTAAAINAASASAAVAARRMRTS